jgi:hypothetical protein
MTPSRSTESEPFPEEGPYLPAHELADESGFYTADDKELLDLVERDIKGWRPQPGQAVVGKLVDVTDATTTYGDGKYPLLVIEAPSGALIGVHCFHTVLRSDIERRISRGTLHIGDRISVKYIGKGEAAEGKSAPEMYRVAVKPAQAAN